MEEEIRDIQPILDNKMEIGSHDKKNNRPFNFFAFKNRLKKKAIKRYAIILLGVAVFINIIAIIYQFSGDFLAVTNNARLAAFFWALSVALAGLSAWFLAEPTRKTKKAKRKLLAEHKKYTLQQRILISIRGFVLNKTFLSLFPILFLAFVLRVIPLMNRGLQLDEWFWLDNAKQILKGGVVSPFGFLGDYPTNLPAYPVSFLLLLVRNPKLAVRLIGVIYSLVDISLVYFLVKKVLGFKAAVCGALLMAVSVWDIHMSKLGYLNVNISPMLVAGVLLLLYQIWEQTHTTRTLFGLAFLVATCVHLLYVSTFLAVPAFLVLLIHWVKNRNSKKLLKEIVLFALFFFVCISPLIPKLIQHPESVARHGEFLQQNVNLSGESKTPLGYYWNQIVLLSQDYVQDNVEFNREGLWGITFDPLVQALSILGILLIIIQVIRKKSDSFWLVVIFTFCVQLFVPFVLLYRTDSVWRAYPILPIVYLFTIYTLYEISRSMKLITKKMFVDRKGLLTIFLTANMTLYFVLNFFWFVDFLSAYTERADMYENTICQTAAELISQNVPKGSTIYMPDEMCFLLVSVLYDENQYHFVNVPLAGPKPNVTSGDYVVILNSQKFSYDFKGDIQAMLLRELSEQQTEMVSLPSDTSPNLYLIK
jgi:hypothetical protein